MKYRQLTPEGGVKGSLWVKYTVSILLSADCRDSVLLPGCYSLEHLHSGGKELEVSSAGKFMIAQVRRSC